MILDARARNVGELLEGIGRIRAEWSPTNTAPDELWFRGQSRRDHPLIPTLYRPKVRESCGDEITYFELFRAYATPHVSPRQLSAWDWYFLARHHGIDSRLLDWSESCLVAAYFALRSRCLTKPAAELHKERSSVPASRAVDNGSPTVWMIDAGTLNTHSVESSADSVVAVPSEAANAYLPDALWERKDDTSEPSRAPIAILPPRVDARIAAQQGVFTLHGDSESSIDDLAGQDDRILVAAILLDSNNVATMWEELRLAGLSEMTLFPDLDHVASHVMRSYEV